MVGKAEDIRRMFAGIHRTYDLLNHLLSAGRDRSWRRRARELAAPAPGERVLDVCTGTGDLALEFQGRAGLVVGVDFVPAMVERARRKAGRRRERPAMLLGDALRLPFAADSFDVVTMAFGLRNLEDLDAGLRELRRVTRPGARVVILEFTRPTGRLSSWSFRFVRAVLPRLGRLVSGHAWAYTYLPESILDFADREQLRERMLRAGLEEVEIVPMRPDFVTVHLGRRS
jgi:demethylmenaquinone methyltransferase/2-methoxy-6-polyprenyl-1,4-benzoquinol methylase